MRLGLIIIILSSALYAGCGGQQVPQDELDKKPPPVPSPSYTLDGMPYVLRFEQGIHNDYDIFRYARVERGNPVISVRNLPESATFDGRTLGWTPPCGKDPEFYLKGIGIHSIIFVLRSDSGADDFIERDAGLVVNEFKDYDGQRLCGEEQP